MYNKNIVYKNCLQKSHQILVSLEINRALLDIDLSRINLKSIKEITFEFIPLDRDRYLKRGDRYLISNSRRIQPLSFPWKASLCAAALLIPLLFMRASLFMHLCELSRRAYLRWTERAADDVDVHLRRLQVGGRSGRLGATRRPTVRPRDDVVVAARRGIGPGFRASRRRDRVATGVWEYRRLETVARQDVHQGLLSRLVDDYGGKCRGLKQDKSSFN